MDPLARTSHEHHDRLIAHVDRLAELAGSLDAGITPEFVVACEAEHRFIVGQLLPHMEAIESTLYGELERLMEGRHSMAPMRREHADLRRLIGSLERYHDLVEAEQMEASDAIGLRRALYRLHAMLRRPEGGAGPRHRARRGRAAVGSSPPGSEAQTLGRRTRATVSR
jgi:hypothetical protein